MGGAQGWAATSTIASIVSVCACAPPLDDIETLDDSPRFRVTANIPYEVEVEAAAVPPGAHAGCADGRVFMAFGNNVASSLMYSLELDVNFCLGLPNCHQFAPLVHPPGTIEVGDQQPPGPDGLCEHPGPNPQVVDEFTNGLTDSVVARMPTSTPGGRIVHVWLGRRAAPPIRPVKIGVGLGDCSQPFITQTLYSRYSDDCGTTWSAPVYLDPNETLRADGTTFDMQRDDDGDNTLDYSNTGFDRQELYVDPFPVTFGELGTTNMAYITVGVGGPYNRDLLFRSFDRGATWGETPLEIGPRADPVVMTTTSNHRLFLFKCERNRPMLRWSDDLGTTVSPPVAVPYAGPEAGICELVRRDFIGGNVLNRANGVAIARMQSDEAIDRVRIAYSTVVRSNPDNPDGGFQRQIIRVVNAYVLRNAGCTSDPTQPGCVTVVNSNTIDEGTEGGFNWQHALQVHFIETDRMEYAPDEADPTAHTAALTWYRSDGPIISPEMSARFAVVRGGFTWTAPANLSVQGGVPQSWPLNVANSGFFGDYSYGAFFHGAATSGDPDLPRFFATWSQSDNPPPAQANFSLHFNVITTP